MICLPIVKKAMWSKETWWRTRNRRSRNIWNWI